MLTLGVAMTIIAFLPPLPLILVLCAIVGFVYGPIAPIYNYVMQTRAPQHLRGRVVGVMGSLAYAAGPLGLVLAGPLADAAGLHATFLALSLPMLLLGLVALSLPALRDLDRDPTADPGERRRTWVVKRKRCRGTRVTQTTTRTSRSLVYQQVLDPVAHSLAWSSLVAAIPLLLLFVLLGVLRVTAWVASLISLAVAIVVAVLVYGMPIGQTLLAGTEGAAFGFFPILWIVINAIWVYQLTVETGHFDVLRRSFASVSDDQRIQAVLIAFSFGALLEALAGFGTPVAVTSVMLMALGFKPLKAAALALSPTPRPWPSARWPPRSSRWARSPNCRATRSVRWSAGRRRSWRCSFPLSWSRSSTAGEASGRPGPRRSCAGSSSRSPSTPPPTSSRCRWPTWSRRCCRPPRWSCWSASGAPAGTYTEPAVVAGGAADEPTPDFAERVEHPDARADVVKAYAPYAIIIAVFVICQITAVKKLLDKATVKFQWPALDIVSPKGKPVSLTEFTLNLLTTPGTQMLIAGIITMIALKLSVPRAVKAYGTTLHQLRWAIVTVMAVLALAFVMNLSGQTITLGTWMAAAGGAFALLSPILGWLGVAVTGSDTSANSLFGALQVTAANQAGLSDVLMAATNSSGGVLGKMISPQNLAIAAAAVGMNGKEGDIFRRVVVWSVVFLVAAVHPVRAAGLAGAFLDGAVVSTRSIEP